MKNKNVAAKVLALVMAGIMIFSAVATAVALILQLL